MVLPVDISCIISGYLLLSRVAAMNCSFDVDVASVRLGRKIRRQDIIKSHRGAPTDDWKFICIEGQLTQLRVSIALHPNWTNAII